MLPSIYRLPKQDFISTMRRGTRTHSEAIQFTYLKTPLTHVRLGMLVTKKFSKKATERNHIRRQIYMAFLPHMTHTSAGMDVVCKITQPMKNIGFEDIQKQIEKFIVSLS